jgi:hypothetical protein
MTINKRVEHIDCRITLPYPKQSDDRKWLQQLTEEIKAILYQRIKERSDLVALRDVDSRAVSHIGESSDDPERL